MRARSRPTVSTRTHVAPARTRRAAGKSGRPRGTSPKDVSPKDVLEKDTSGTSKASPTAPAGGRDLELREALRVSREAIVAIQNELDALLRSVQANNAARGSGTAGTAPAPRADAIERLARSTRRADAAVRGLSTSSS